jgi:hypothetical protein
MFLTLLVRYHWAPAMKTLSKAVRRGPVVWAVALFVVGCFVGQTARGVPAIPLPSDSNLAGALSLGATLALATAFSWPTVALGSRRRVFFAARPGGPRALFFYALGRSLASWVGAASVVVVVCGPGSWAWLVAASLPFSVGLSSLLLVRTSSVPASPRPQVPGVMAWWLSHPVIYLVPAVLWVALMAWAVGGHADFRWADHPASGDLLVDFGWTTVFGLLWSEARPRVPWTYFRFARAPFRRVATVVGAPVLVMTLAAAVAGSALAGPWPGPLRAAVLTLTGAAFWFCYWLRVGPSGVSLVVFVTLLAAGAAADRDWWPLWALAQTVGALVLWSGWRTLYYEGDVYG